MRDGDGDERRSRWQDERIDDLATLARANQTRLDTLQNLVAVHDIQLIELKRDLTARTEHRWQMQLTLLAVLLTSIGTLVATVISLYHH